MPIPDLKKIIKDEDLNPDYYEEQANAIVTEFQKKITDPIYVLEKVRHLTDLAFLVCRAKEGRENTEKVKKCVEDFLNPRWI